MFFSNEITTKYSNFVKNTSKPQKILMVVLIKMFFLQQYNDPTMVFRQNIFAFDGAILDGEMFQTKTCFNADKEMR